MAGITLHVQGVSRLYHRGQEEVHALQDVTLTLRPGELTLILGPSGGGKSTLLHVLGGMDRPNLGRIIADTTDVTGLRPDRLAQWRRRTVGFIFQNFYLLPGASALDNVALPLLLDGQRGAVRRARARSLLEGLGLGDRLTFVPSELSGGQIQRVAIARALAQDPPLILADEPTGNLDSASGRDIMMRLAALAHEDGRTVVVVSHNEEFAALADRVVRIRDGHVESESGPASDAAAPETATGSTRATGPSVFSLIASSVRSLNRRRGRSLFTSLGVTIGVASMVLLVSLGAGLQARVLNVLEASTSLTTISVTSQQTTSGLTLSPTITSGTAHPINAHALETFRRRPHVRAAYGVSEFLGSARVGDASTTVVVTNLAPRGVTGVSRPNLLSGSLPTGTRPGIVLPKSVATNLFHVPSRSLSHVIGRTLRLTLEGTVGPLGITGPAGAPPSVPVVVRGVAGSTAEAIAYVNNALAGKWLKRLTGPQRQVEYGSADVIAVNTQDVSAIANQLKAEGYGVTTAQSVIQQIHHTFGVIETVLGVIGGIALAVAGIMIGVVMSMAVLERRREIGVWRALGARRGDIFVLFLVEAVLIGVAGGIIGDALGWGLGVLGAALLHHPGLFVVPRWLLALGIGFGGGVGAVAGSVPANLAAGLRPVDALRAE
jgi:macrolide transport system ATP-binding/permease protein